MNNRLFKEYWVVANELLDSIIVKTALERLNEHLGLYKSTTPTMFNSSNPVIDLEDGLRLETRKIKTSHPKWDKYVCTVYFNDRKIIEFKLPFKDLHSHLNMLFNQKIKEKDKSFKRFNAKVDELKNTFGPKIKKMQSELTNRDNTLELNLSVYSLTFIVKNPVTKETAGMISSMIFNYNPFRMTKVPL